MKKRGRKGRREAINVKERVEGVMIREEGKGVDRRGY